MRARTSQRHRRAYSAWSAGEDSLLLALHHEGTPVNVIAAELERQPGAIRSRLAKLADRINSTKARPAWRKGRPRAGRRWESAEDAALLADFDAGVPLQEIAARSGRGLFAVQVRLIKLGRGV
jgi:hypothetical protein